MITAQSLYQTKYNQTRLISYQNISVDSDSVSTKIARIINSLIMTALTLQTLVNLAKQNRNPPHFVHTIKLPHIFDRISNSTVSFACSSNGLMRPADGCCSSSTDQHVSSFYQSRTWGGRMDLLSINNNMYFHQTSIKAINIFFENIWKPSDVIMRWTIRRKQTNVYIQIWSQRTRPQLQCHTSATALAHSANSLPLLVCEPLLWTISWQHFH